MNSKLKMMAVAVALATAIPAANARCVEGEQEVARVEITPCSRIKNFMPQIASQFTSTCFNPATLSTNFRSWCAW